MIGALSSVVLSGLVALNVILPIVFLIKIGRRVWAAKRKFSGLFWVAHILACNFFVVGFMLVASLYYVLVYSLLLPIARVGLNLDNGIAGLLLLLSLDVEYLLLWRIPRDYIRRKVGAAAQSGLQSTSENWVTWSPFQSPAVSEICAHMTDAEQNAVAWRAGIYGLWGAATFAIPLSLAMVERDHVHVMMAVVLVPIHLVCIPFWLQMQKQFLCATVWAREHGFTPERFKMFAFRSLSP